MDQGPLVSEQIDAASRFIAEFQKVIPLQAAFWLREGEEGEWYLYIASDQINDDNLDVSYGEVLRVAGQIKDPWFDPFQVKLISADDPLAKAALDIYKKYAGHIPTRFHGKNFGGVTVDELYLYPLAQQ